RILVLAVGDLTDHTERIPGRRGSPHSKSLTVLACWPAPMFAVTLSESDRRPVRGCVMTAETIERPRPRPEAVCLGSAVVGAVVWGAGLFLVSWSSWAEPLVVLGALVVCPLALFVTAPTDRYPWPWRAAVWMQFPGALLLLPSFARNPGPIAGSLALPWLLITVLVALFGLLRLLSHWRGQVEEWAIDAGLLYLAVGGGWLILSRLGARPLDFGEPIILLTAGHFHYAGLALPILTGLAS